MAFLLASLLKNANGAAVLMVLPGLFFFILAESLTYSKWNLFLNPFDMPSNMSYTIWKNVLFQNRMMLSIGSVVCLLWSLINLQRRERLV